MQAEFKRIEVDERIEVDDARALAESRRRDHVAHELEIERGDEDAHQLARAAARLDDEVDDRLAAERGDFFYAAAENFFEGRSGGVDLADFG